MAYTLTKADVLLIAGELNNLDDARWAEAILFAKQRVANCEAWGGDDRAKQAATWLAAHYAKLILQAETGGAASSAGPVLRIKVGPVEKEFGSLSDLLGDKDAASAGLALTRYGVMFRGLQRTFAFVRGFVA